MKNLTRIKRSGFTIVEIMVVMAIMAVMSVLGILAMVGINNGVIADRQAEALLSLIRESQNKALSVESLPGDVIEFPLAWTVNITPGTGTDAIQYYMTKADASFTRELAAVNLGNVGDITITSIKDLGGVGGDLGSASITFTSPFGKYYGAAGRADICLAGVDLHASCERETSRPYDLKVLSDAGAALPAQGYEITLSFRGTERKIIVEENGDVSISS